MLIYWITPHLTELHKQKSKILQTYQYEVHFFSNTKEMLKAYRLLRAGIIFFTETEDHKQHRHEIFFLINFLPIQGARFILILESGISQLAHIAMCGNFHDIIPLNLDPKEWLHRIQYSTSRKSINLTNPLGRFSVNHMTTIVLPIRVIWLTEKNIRFEASFLPIEGDLLKLTGSFADHIGVNYILLKVKNCEDTNLKFRFSQAITAEWKVNKLAAQRMKGLIQKLTEKEQHHCKVFVVAQSTGIRNQVIDVLIKEKHYVYVALNKKSILEDPKYIKPEIIFIEGSLFKNQDVDTCQTLINQIPEDLFIIIFGKRSEIYELPINFQARSIQVIESIDDHFRNLLREYAEKFQENKTDNPSIRGYFPVESTETLGYITFQAKLTKIHPRSIELQMRYFIPTFALLKINSPWLTKIFSKPVFGKITHTHKNNLEDDNSMKYIADVMPINIDQKFRKIAGKEMLKTYLELMKHYLPTKSQEDSYLVIDQVSTSSSKHSSIKENSLTDDNLSLKPIKQKKNQKEEIFQFKIEDLRLILFFFLIIIFVVMLIYFFIYYIYP